MEGNQSKEDAKIVSVKWRKKLVKDFIEPTLPVEQKGTVITVTPSNRGGKKNEKEETKK